MDHESFLGRLAIFARTFASGDFAQACSEVRRTPIRSVQLNLSCAGLPTLPDRLDGRDLAAISKALEDNHLRVAAVSGTFNMIDPDADRRADNLRRLDVLAASCEALGTRTITLCTGTRDPDDMWRGHADNASPEAWADLVASMREATATAEHHDVTLAFEPEVGNVVDSARKARQLLDEIGSPCLKVVLDPANLLRPGDLPGMREVIEEAFDLLASDVAILHAKEIAADGSCGHLAPGEGVLDFAHVFGRYLRANMTAPIVLHGLPANRVDDGVLALWKACAMGSSTGWFGRDGLNFRYLDQGEGLPFVFQHGLGGALEVPYGLVGPMSGTRLISFDARYHGETRPLGHPAKLSFHDFADDLLALLDHLGIERAVVGGISMGAGQALNFAIRYPNRTLGLVLSRPAWLDEPFPENIRMFAVMADLIRSLGASEGLEAFERTVTYADVLAESTDSAATLAAMFAHPRAEETAEKFDRIPRDCPWRDRAAWRSIRVPTLVLANHRDPIHPYEMGLALAAAIPGATLRLLTPKCEDAAQHGRDTTAHVSEFLRRNFLEPAGVANGATSRG